MTSGTFNSISTTLIRVAAAQVNTTVGDIEGNSQVIEKWIKLAQIQQAELIAFPELTITGYPPEDLVLYADFIEANKTALRHIATKVKDIVVVVGFVDSEDGKLFNSAAVLHQGKIVTTYRKIHLPNYGVFDERRYFTPGDECPVISIRGIKIGINICEDIWEPIGPSEVQRKAGAQIIINLNSSPYQLGKHRHREEIVSDLSRRNNIYTLYTNQIGGQDELVFDGGSMLFDPDGKLLGNSPRFEESLLVADIKAKLTEIPVPCRQDHTNFHEKLSQVGKSSTIEIPIIKPQKKLSNLPELSISHLGRLESVYHALIIGTRDYLKKTGFKKVIIAVSGGIDSALVTTIATDAIGAENVIGVALPSRYSSEGSITDARELCSRLNVELWTIPIEQGHVAFEGMLSDTFKGTEPGLSEENTQSRIRGNLMMSIANKFNWLVLSTGNKSEMATGYATLYGDMAGAYAVIKDVPKTLVYELSEHRNARGSGCPIPKEIIDKPPSAELRPDQLDEDSLPPYDQLDRIIHMYIEERLSPDLIIQKERKVRSDDNVETVVRRIVQLIDKNEYKRRQAPPGVKITGLAFGRDRRLPIASVWEH
ncbi:MAG: NAD+ synthase [SAR202 cluster bacterium]|nr:NAD+ synthase [SAR202 cluster bacterium]